MKIRLTNSRRPSWSRMMGVTKAKRNLSRQVGMPITKTGRELKFAKLIADLFKLR
jgi:hypothetical protein